MPAIRRREGANKTYVFVSHDRGCVLIEGIRLSTRRYRRANVIAVMGTGRLRGFSGAALLNFGRRVSCPFSPRQVTLATTKSLVRQNLWRGKVPTCGLHVWLWLDYLQYIGTY